MLQKQATYRRTPPDLKYTIQRAGEEGGGESEYCIPTSAPFLLTERESVLGPLHPAGPVGHLALDDGRAALGHVHVARPRPEELLLLRRRRRRRRRGRLPSVIAAASPRGDERGSGVASRT